MAENVGSYGSIKSDADALMDACKRIRELEAERDQFTTTVQAIRAEERERCAVIAERFAENSRYRIRHQNLQPLEAVRRTMTEDIAAAIRAQPEVPQ